MGFENLPPDLAQSWGEQIARESADYAQKYGATDGLNSVIYALGDESLKGSSKYQDAAAITEGTIKNKKKIKDMQAATATTSKANAAQVRSVLGGSAPQAQTPQSILGGSSATKSLLGL